MKKSLYQLLGVPADAGAEEIAAAYKAAGERLAADGNDDPNQRIILREAFQILSHPQKRAAYDASLARPLPDAVMRDSGDRDTRRRSRSVPLTWFIGSLLAMGVVFWWYARKPAPKPVTVIAQKTMEAVPVAVEAPQPQPAEQDAPAASTGSARSAEELYAELAPSVARINVFDNTGRGIAIGSGVVIAAGEVITNCHVTRGGAQLQAKIGGNTYPASVTVADEEFDLCRLHVQGSNDAPVSIGTAATLRTGQKVYAIGAPQGLELTISDGIVSSLREVTGGTVIQTTTPVSPGSSGGGLFDVSGKLVGIVTFQHRYGQNLNFAVPAEWIGQMRTRESASPAFAPR